MAHAPKSPGTPPPRPAAELEEISSRTVRTRSTAWREVTASVPTHTTPLTPAAAASDSTETSSSPSGRYRSCRWQCESIQRAVGAGTPPDPGASGAHRRHALRRGNNGAAFSTGNPPG